MWRKDNESCVVPFQCHPALPCLPGWILRGETKPEINSGLACEPLCCHLPAGKHEDIKDISFSISGVFVKNNYSTRFHLTCWQVPTLLCKNKCDIILYVYTHGCLLKFKLIFILFSFKQFIIQFFTWPSQSQVLNKAIFWLSLLMTGFRHTYIHTYYSQYKL